MATTLTPLVWDFYRETGASGVVGGVIHFHDNVAQSLYNSGGLNANAAEVPNGHWATAIWDETHQINDVIYFDMDIDHPYSGTAFGVGVNSENQLIFLRYVYAMDCTQLIESGNLNYSNTNAVTQLKVNIMNINKDIFMSDATIFQPGSKSNLSFVIGDEEPYNMCVAYLDSVDFNITSETVSISGRNAIGFKLMESTFDDVQSINGTPNEVLSKIFKLAGITNFVIQQASNIKTYEFKSEQTLMSGVEQVIEGYSTWKIVELHNGMIIVGSPEFISSYQSNSYYVFNENEAFKRKTKRNSDIAYAKVRVTGKDANDNDLIPVTLPVKNWEWWSLPSNKTYHESVPDGYTQSELQAYAEHLAESLQYVGIGEDFTSSLRPHLLIGDIAAVDNGDGTMTTLGIVNSIKHKFGKSGYTTDFSTDSGGIVMDNARSEFIATATKSLGGYTRQQTLKDMIQVASGSATAGPKTSGNTTRVVNTSNALTLEGKTYNQIVAAAAAAVPDELPDYTEQDYGKALVPGANGLIWKEFTANSDELVKEATNAAIEAALDAVTKTGAGNYIAPNIINYSYETTTGTTVHSRTYEGTVGNKLLLFIMHRGELTTSPEGWELLTVLEESGDYTVGSATYTQYVSVFTKTCIGIESINYEQIESATSMTCFIEFEGISGFKVLEETRQENIASETTITCMRTSTYMAIWAATAVYFTNNKFNWDISNDNIWAISDNHNIQPRLGVFVDNRPAPATFSISSGMTGRYVSAVCIQTIPIKTETKDESQGEETPI